jgi:tetratricopeptide (TPR) repeat protein
VILDLLQNNNWERPIYYAVTVGDENYLGLKSYFQLEGLAYRIVPTKGANQVNTDAMYDNMLHKFKWGGIENPKVYLDENNLRMTSTFRHMFTRLVNALISEGKRDSARTALDYCMEVIPSKTVPHTYVSVILASQYYQLGEKEKAEAILNEILTNSLQYLKWFSDLTANQLRSASSDFGQQLGIFQEILQVAENYGNKTLIDENYPLFLEYSKTYNLLK